MNPGTRQAKDQPRCKLAVTGAVETVSVVAAAEVPGFSTAGLNEQDEPVGKLAQAKETLRTLWV
jgi:hypothetical protein